MSGFVARACFAMYALWASASVIVDAIYFYDKRTSPEEDEAAKLRVEYFQSAPNPTKYPELAKRIIQEAMEVEVRHANEVVVYHTLTPTNVMTSLIFGAVVRGRHVDPPLPKNGPFNLALRDYTDANRLPGCLNPDLFNPRTHRVDEPVLYEDRWCFMLGKYKPNRNFSFNLQCIKQDSPPPGLGSMPLGFIERRSKFGRLEDYGFASTYLETDFVKWNVHEVPLVHGLRVDTMPRVAHKALREGGLPDPLTAETFYNAIASSALYKAPDERLDHMPAVRNRLLSVNYNLFGYGSSNSDESSWSMLFRDDFSVGSSSKGWAGESPLLNLMFEKQKASPAVQNRVRQQLVAIGQVFDGAQQEGFEFQPPLESLFPALTVDLRLRAGSLAIRQKPSDQTAVMLQIVMPEALADKVMYFSAEYGWAPTALPDKPQGLPLDDDKEWPQRYLRDVWGMACSDPEAAAEYFHSKSVSERYRLLKHRREIDMQARVLLTREASGFEGDSVKMYAHGSLFQTEDLAEVLFAMAEGVRKTLVPETLA